MGLDLRDLDRPTYDRWLFTNALANVNHVRDDDCVLCGKPFWRYDPMWRLPAHEGRAHEPCAIEANRRLAAAEAVT